MKYKLKEIFMEKFIGYWKRVMPVELRGVCSMGDTDEKLNNFLSNF
jgi:hypothetical protein